MKSFQGLAHFQAKIKRAGVLMKMGRLDEAHIDAENVLRKEPKNEEAHKIYSMIEPVKEKLQEVDSLIRSRQHQPAISLLGELLEQIPWDPYLREQRAEAYLGIGNIIHAISDIKSVVKLRFVFQGLCQ